MKECCTADQHASVLNLPPVQGRWPGSCFVCSEGHPHGLGLRFHHTADGVACLTSVPAGYCGFDGMVHGGIISALMDEAAAYALFARHGRLGVTREITVRFLKPVATGTEIRVVGQVLNFDPPEAEVAMAIYDAGGQRLAEGRTTWSFPRLSRIAALAGVEEEVLQNFLDDCQKVS
ncbi:PaaI family thioesterase [Geomonas anaerohicana]|uniref:PaaI family thioesterase n=1 Tax=Geomonas anaerohicana TaxID=2798583 RepID=A0ABS0YKH7_9BACT|nr:PaaI family thioesterase [Geomonas anaerohicana]MBJ6752848.1 PaaI family thioesterase [Geomonas anaerohicana]